jgi:membrane protein implicated in regulation of membrane protease activity
MSIVDFLWNLGLWNWFILAVILFLLETVIPGVHFVWFGLAAFAVGALSFFIDVTWQWQLVIFAAIAC